MAASSLLHHGLMSFPENFRRRGIYWLRLYRVADTRHIAVVTEVPGNAGPSATNAASLVAAAIGKQFSIEAVRLDLFIIWPRLRWSDGSVQGASYSLSPGATGPGWRKVSRGQIEEIVGPLPPLPDHDTLFRDVLALGGRRRETYREVFEAVPIDSLPPPHAPYGCEHHDRFKKMSGEATSDDDALAAGRLFIDSLTDDDRRRCRYHEGDWAAIADASARIVDELPGVGDPDYLSAARNWPLLDRDRAWLMSLFFHPIVLDDDRKGYTNGQHRGCALRSSGADRAAVVVDGELTQYDDADWTYLGDG